MAKVGIITFLHNENYGSTLQAYALQRVIREAGHTCEHLDYRPDHTEKLKNLLESGNSPKLVLEGLRKREVRAGQAGAKTKSEAIPDFYRKQMHLTPPCANRKELSERSRDYDVLLCGSDQVWNPVWLNPAYFLTFAGKGQKKAAYAASLGISALPAKSKVRKIRRWTEDFQAISVREKEGADLMEKMTGRRPEVMPDPVCLLSAEEWEAVTGPAPEGDPYLLCYFIGTNPRYWDKVRRLNRELGLRVLVVPVTAESYEQEYEKLDGLGPEAFLGALRGASCICTDSFHGLVFGTIFGIRTELIRRYRKDDPESKNSRVDHFRRLVKDMGTEELRTQGRNWLREVLG